MITLVMVLNEEYQGLVDNTADGNKAKKKKEVPSWGAGDEASSRPRAPQMPVPGVADRGKKPSADAAGRASPRVVGGLAATYGCWLRARLLLKGF